MKERPLPCKGWEVRAIREGRKTQTRRLVKDPGWNPGEYQRVHVLLNSDPKIGLQAYFERDGQDIKPGIPCPYGQPGDRLWVREIWGMSYVDIVPSGRQFVPGGTWGSPARPNRPPCVVFQADGDMPDDSPLETARWSPSIHMPRWASRITLEIVSVRVERLQEISPDDCRAEGMPADNNDIGVRYGFGQLWQSIHGPGSWDANPFVWVIEFRRIKP